jgi:hypothetical protein
MYRLKSYHMKSKEQKEKTFAAIIVLMNIKEKIEKIK